MSKKEEDNKDRDNHQGSIVAEDDELTLWLNRLWARNEPPERIELWQVFGSNRANRGELIHHEDFKPNEKLNIEQANKLANEIMAAAQNDCDAVRKEAWYQLAIIDRNRKASPLVRRIGPIQPKRSYAIAKGAETEDDDTELDARALNLKQIHMGIEQTRWGQSRNDRVNDGILLLMHNIIQDQRKDLASLMVQQMACYQQLQDSLDRSLDRELVRDREKFKIGLWKDGMRTVRNILPGLFDRRENGGQPSETPIANNGGQKDYGPSTERTLADNFLNDCEEASLSIPLFGDFEEKNGKMVQVKPGIFTVEQLRVLIGVRDGALPASAVDQLMPQSGHANAITEEQVKKAMAAGVTEGIGMALMQIVSLRTQAQAPVEATFVEASP